MPVSKVSRPYAQALFRLSEESKNLDKIYEESKSIISLIENSKDLRSFLESPAVPSQKKQAILKEIFKNKIDAFILRFILFLEHKNRLDILKEALQIFQDIHLESKNIIKVTLTSRWELAADEIATITQYLKTRFQKDILPQMKIDTSILGGIKIQIGDDILDYTLATQLKNFKHNVIWS